MNGRGAGAVAAVVAIVDKEACGNGITLLATDEPLLRLAVS